MKGQERQQKSQSPVRFSILFIIGTAILLVQWNTNNYSSIYSFSFSESRRLLNKLNYSSHYSNHTSSYLIRDSLYNTSIYASPQHPHHNNNTSPFDNDVGNNTDTRQHSRDTDDPISDSLLVINSTYSPRKKRHLSSNSWPLIGEIHHRHPNNNFSLKPDNIVDDNEDSQDMNDAITESLLVNSTYSSQQKHRHPYSSSSPIVAENIEGRLLAACVCVDGIYTTDDQYYSYMHLLHSSLFHLLSSKQNRKGTNLSNIKIKSSYLPYCRAAEFSTYGLDPDEDDDIPTTSESSNTTNITEILRTPTIIQNGIRNENAALVSTTTDGIVIAFRGTLPVPSMNNPDNLRSVIDWVQDFMALPIEADAADREYIRGLIHAGLYRGVKSVWAEERGFFWWLRWFLMDTTKSSSNIRERLSKILVGSRFLSLLLGNSDINEEHNNYLSFYIKDELKRRLLLLNEERSQCEINCTREPIQVYITGHSKGGGMASIAALMVQHELTNLVQTLSLPHLDMSTSPVVYTFAGVKPGNLQFKEHYERNIVQYSFENFLDPIPFYPPSDLEYKVFKEQILDLIDSEKQDQTNRVKGQDGTVFLGGKAETLTALRAGKPEIPTVLSREEPETPTALRGGKAEIPTITQSVERKDHIMLLKLLDVLDLVKGNFESVGQRFCISNNKDRSIIPYQPLFDIDKINPKASPWDEEKDVPNTFITAISSSEMKLSFKQWMSQNYNIKKSVGIRVSTFVGSVSTVELDTMRLKEIASLLVDGETPLAHHKPSCRENGYMHGLSENFCVAHFEEKAYLKAQKEVKDSND